MARLESDKVEHALRYKMKAEREDSGDWYYYVKDEEKLYDDYLPKLRYIKPIRE